MNAHAVSRPSRRKRCSRFISRLVIKMDKVRGGTPSFHKDSLCFSCESAHVTTGNRNGRSILCNMINKPIREKIFTCSGYECKGKPQLWDMKAIAWRIETDRNRGFLGFKPPDQNNTRYGPDGTPI